MCGSLMLAMNLDISLFLMQPLSNSISWTYLHGLWIPRGQREKQQASLGLCSHKISSAVSSQLKQATGLGADSKGLGKIHLLKEQQQQHRDGKASAYSVVDLGSIPGSGRSSGEGNGNPLQYPSLQATVHGVAKSRTRLSDSTFTFTYL